MDKKEIKERAAEFHEHNTKKVVAMIIRESNLRNLHTILDPITAEVYRMVIPKHAKLCELDQQRGLNNLEKAELAIAYGSLYHSFGDRGVVEVTAAWISTRPDRQARDN